MDTLETYRQIIINVLKEYAQIPYAYGQVESQVILDRDSDRYLLIVQEWENQKRVHGCLVHIDIIDNKIWIQRDGIEYGIANELVEKGISKKDIVLGFHPPSVRPYTEFAVG
jgi:hypothetical protein